MNGLVSAIWIGVLGLASAPNPAGSTAAGNASKGPVSFVKDVAPILVEHCLACHNPKTKKGDFDLSSFELIEQSGYVEAGKPADSFLYQLMTGQEKPAMPFESEPLDAPLLATVQRWIAEGAKFDGPAAAAPIRDLVPQRAKPIPTNYTVPTPTTALAFQPDGTALAAAGYHEITFWNPQTGQLLGRLPTRAERIYALDYSPDGKYLVHAGGIPGQMGEVVIWEVPGRKAFRTLVGEAADVVYTARFSPDGKQVAAGGTDRIFRIWDLASGKEVASVENHADWILDITFSPDGKRIITASRDKSSKVWDQTTREPVLTFPAHTDGVFGVSVSPDGKLVASVGADRQLRFWEPAGEGKPVRNVAAHGGGVHAVEFAPVGSIVFTAGADNLVKSWNPANGAAVKTYSGHKDWVYSIALARDGKRLASGAWDGEVRVWDVESGQSIAAFLAVPTLALAKAQEKPAPATAVPGKSKSP